MFKPCSRGVGNSRWWGSLTMVPAENKAKCLSSVNHTTKTIHHYRKSFFLWKFGSGIKGLLFLTDVTSLMSLCFLTFSTDLQIWIAHLLEEVFLEIVYGFCLNFVFKSMCGFSQASWLKKITLLICFSFNPWFIACHLHNIVFRVI